MDEKSIEYKVLNKLINTYIFCVVAGLVGVAFKFVHVEFMEGVVFGGLLNMIGGLMKDLFFNDKNGGPDVAKDNPILPKPSEESSIPKV